MKPAHGPGSYGACSTLAGLPAGKDRRSSGNAGRELIAVAFLLAWQSVMDVGGILRDPAFRSWRRPRAGRTEGTVISQSAPTWFSAQTRPNSTETGGILSGSCPCRYRNRNCVTLMADLTGDLHRELKPCTRRRSLEPLASVLRTLSSLINTSVLYTNSKQDSRVHKCYLHELVLSDDFCVSVGVVFDVAHPVHRVGFLADGCA